jgi:hypothetical protein
MTKPYETFLMFQIHDMELSQDDAFYNALKAARENNEEAIRKAEDNYHKAGRLAQLGYEMLLVGDLSDWDWTWAARSGHLCKKDFEWFAEELAKVGVISYEDYITNWYKPKLRSDSEKDKN